MVIAKISAANVVPHMLAPKNPVGTESKQATVHPSLLSNMTKKVVTQTTLSKVTHQKCSTLQENNAKF